MGEAPRHGDALAGRLDLAPEVRLVPAAFHETYGYGAKGVWRAPGSVTLLSDHGASLSMAARWGTIVAASPREDDTIELALMNRPADRERIDLGALRPGATEPWAAAALSAAWALQVAGCPSPIGGATLLAGVDLPDGTGLGASTATACAVALALRDLYAPYLPLDTLSTLVAHGLRAFGAADDHQADQCRATLLARQGTLRLDEGSDVGFVPLDLEAAGLRLLLVDTRVRAEPLSPVVERTPLREVASRLSSGDLAVLGAEFTAAHTRLCEAGVPSREQRTVVTAALDAGALGGRMIWDGPGRPALLLVRAADLGPIRTAITRACLYQRLRSPRFLTVTPYGPAAQN
ncbi:galactokinase family protein [Spirillospora sp. NPDC052269]